MAFVFPKITCPVPDELPEDLAVSADDDPFDGFQRWFDDALAKVPEANAMALATVDFIDGGTPTNRIVYLRYWDRRGFVFFTNLRSQKGYHLTELPFAELLFYWPQLWRQVRISGGVEAAESELADEYFRTRPRESQLAAWASLQSRPIDPPDAFEIRLAHFKEKFLNQDVPRPEHWLGIRVIPTHFEFWQGQEARHHDRRCFLRSSVDDDWRFLRLFP